ncbi:Catenin alpha [Eumeta japonica]|uniref:Catenin alpha n=1 Tax=Eumeta variegata TaxID=151549 RepID=A0A4C1TA51_EUMVA|nr:Catenin alpha [Eumeta japonica]
MDVTRLRNTRPTSGTDVSETNTGSSLSGYITENHIQIGSAIVRCAHARSPHDSVYTYNTTLYIEYTAFESSKSAIKHIAIGAGAGGRGVCARGFLVVGLWKGVLLMSKFAVRVDAAVSALGAGGGAGAGLDENDFIDASRLVYDAVREIRRAVLMNREDEDLDPEDVELDEQYTLETRSKCEIGVVYTSDDLDTDTEFEPVEDMTMETRSRSSAHTGEHGVDEYPDISGITNAREAMRKMTEEDKRKILQQVELFRREKMTFDNEVAKWDDAGNDIIMLAKHMCMIMMEMTDFTRGRGPLKTTMDVINAAKKISEAGTKLDKLTREIAEQCPESSTKQDLLAYLQRIALYCHQIQITSKVKADVQNISGELIVSGLDSATSLIQAAKNLMNAVVLTVKASYVASTKYTRQGTIASPIVVWRMKAPEKKPLVRPEKPEEVRAKVRRGSQKRQPSPIHALAEFQSPAESV